jgi:hypothetical protein
MTRAGSDGGLARAYAAAVLAFRRELERHMPSGVIKQRGAKDPERGYGGELADPRLATDYLGRSQVGSHFSGPW